ncbi:MAG: hypothetical protein HOV68_30095 [Streptomycetaceae bacterium]|nr:hypothetical protein [Streptomycetaceae bacterium]
MRNENDTDPGPKADPSTGFIAGRMVAGIERLETFELKVQGVIDLLQRGPMRDKPAGEPVRPGAYGNGFVEAVVIQQAMGGVVGHLDRFAKLLNAQIEVLRLSVKMATSETAMADQANRQAMAKALAESERIAATPVVAGPGVKNDMGPQPGRGTA